MSRIVFNCLILFSFVASISAQASEVLTVERSWQEETNRNDYQICHLARSFTVKSGKLYFRDRIKCSGRGAINSLLLALGVKPKYTVTRSTSGTGEWREVEDYDQGRIRLSNDSSRFWDASSKAKDATRDTKTFFKAREAKKEGSGIWLSTTASWCTLSQILIPIRLGDQGYIIACFTLNLQLAGGPPKYSLAAKHQLRSRLSELVWHALQGLLVVTLLLPSVV